MLLIEKLDQKEFYTIKDVSEVTGKTSQTVRSWELKGIIKKPKETIHSVGLHQAGWRKYSREEFIEVLSDLIKYPWKRNVIQNKTELEFYIEYLKGNKDIKEMSIQE